MVQCKDVVQEHLANLVSRITKMKDDGQDTSSCLGELVLRLNSQFPGDVGCFCAYFLNHVTLQPGEAMFLGPNLPHAYLSGGMCLWNTPYLLKYDWYITHKGTLAWCVKIIFCIKYGTKCSKKCTTFKNCPCY